ncbi:ribonuclease R [Enterococcus timonensis]|uniref:ribonuclease R n=1 Tax=Enterococcus timonensis TaxID=1852364 RepID=UPI0008DAE6EC|nr:ribonuclease R [Enterococcus timonensis]
MNPLKSKIITVLQSSDHALSMAELAESLQLGAAGDFKTLVKTISQMEKEGAVIFSKKGLIKLPQENVELTGVLRLNDRGFGFVNYDPEEEDVYIANDQVGAALDNDIVAFDILHPANPFTQKGPEGKITRVIEHQLTQITGEFVPYDKETATESGYLGYLLPKEIKLQNYKIDLLDNGLHPAPGSIVVASIKDYPDEKKRFTASVITILGHKNDPGMDILSLVVSLGMETKFSKEVLDEAQEVPETISESEFASRVDKTHEQLVTIDGADAKDLDDAVTVHKLENGNFFLGVHIADVSHYVTEGTALNETALARGTSVYLADRVIPMLPQRLSNDICSLNPGVPRLTLSCEMEITPNGKVVQHKIFKSVIKTTARMTYQAVNEILEDNNEETIAQYQDLVPMFNEMSELHEILQKMRSQRGAINFEDREAKMIIDDKGKVTDIVLRERGVGEKMIESFMLAANETVAAHFKKLDVPFIYRIHEAPKEEKMEKFFEFVTVFGLKIHGTKNNITATDLQDILAKVQGKPEAAVISTMLLRSMQQAKYTTEPVGHFGLGAEDYTHFTSPIRRYPDLMVHRLIHYYAENSTPAKTAIYEQTLPDIAQHASQMERKAVDAERMVDAMKKAEYLQDHLGEIFEGVISSVTKFGLFIELDNTIEGLVHVNSLHDDFYHFLEGKMALVGERTGVMYQLGEKIRIKVEKSDPVTRQIDFSLVDRKKGNKANRPEKAGGKNKKNQHRSKDQHKNSNSSNKKSSSNSRNSSNSKNNSPSKNKKKNNKAPFYKGAKKKK